MDDLKEVITKDGSFSLRSMHFNENFHCSLCAFNETQKKFINPSNVQRFENKSLSVLDVCFGIGYNSAFLFNNLLNQSSHLNWYALEIDKRPINLSLNNDSFRKLWDTKVIQIFESLLLKGIFQDDFFNCKLIWGDARNGISKIPSDVYFDLIFLDGFSPQKCPEIWTKEFLSKLKAKLNPKGYLITYSSSAAVRRTLIDLNLKIYNIKPTFKDISFWSNGTLAIKNEIENLKKENSYLEKLSRMEMEHLQTKASIPYRDPGGKSSSDEIIKRRKQEQLLSNLTNTMKWRKKWKMTK